MITKLIIKDFPVLSRKINEYPIVYLDNSATTQVPKYVINSLVNYYSLHKANVHRGVHTLSEESTEMFEKARETIAKFINCSSEELVIIKNSTEGSNLIANAFLPSLLKKGDTILVSEFEHHSNLLPWIEISKKIGLNVKKIPFDKDFEVDLNKLKKLKFKFLAINHVSNFLGNINNIEDICEVCNKKGAYSFIDSAQSIAHINTDVKKIGCSFLAFSGHKIYGPFGSGGLYINKRLYKNAEPYLVGGGMISYVSFSKTKYVDFSEKYDAGTPNVADTVALASALEYFLKLGKKNIFNHEEEVINYLYTSLKNTPKVTIYGPTKLAKRSALVSFNVSGVHSHDLASVLDSVGVAIRSGQHCTMPAHTKLNINASARASVGLYNFKEDVDRLIFGIEKAKKLLT